MVDSDFKKNMKIKLLKSKTIKRVELNDSKRNRKSPKTTKNRGAMKILAFPGHSSAMKVHENLEYGFCINKVNPSNKSKGSDNNQNMIDSFYDFGNSYFDKTLDVSSSHMRGANSDESGIVKKTRDYLYNLPINLVPLEQDFNQFYKPIDKPVYDETIFNFQKSKYLGKFFYNFF